MRRLIVLGLLVGCGATDGPHLDSVTPTEGIAGDHVVLAGDGFCADARCDPLPAAYVSFGIDPQIDGVVTSWQADAIEAMVPPGVAPGEILIVVTVDGRSSNGVSFRVR